MATPPKTGPLTAQDLRDIWAGSVDSAYRIGFEEAGDGRGLEAWGQSWAQLARVSLEVDKLTQEMFILPWSGQTGEPAGGPRTATVTLTIARTGLVDKPLVLSPGQFFVEELQLDHSEGGSVEVLTGRRYTPVSDVVFGPGEVGPLDFAFVAERIGDGYNNPMPGTISAPTQLGADFYHDEASVLITPAGPVGPAAPSRGVALRCANAADMLIPGHVGQYVLMTAGANVRNVARVTSYVGPTTTIGSTSTLELEQAVQGATHAGAFQAGELVAFDNGGPAVAYGRAIGARLGGDGILRLVFVLLSGGSIAPASVATGQVSGATLTVDLYSFAQDFAAETDAASWRVLGWTADWGLEISNALSPVDGRHAWLDELGGERAIYRSPGEEDDLYRPRVARIADVVSPNAVKRALNRALGAIPWCFREVGSAAMPGFYYDGPDSPPTAGSRQSTDAAFALTIDAYDTDVILVTGSSVSGIFQGPPFQIAEEVVIEDLSTLFTVAKGRFGGFESGGTVLVILRTSGGVPPGAASGYRVRGLRSGATFDSLTAIAIPATVAQRRWHVVFDYVEFRAFFLVGVPPLGSGDFGYAYDAGPHDAYDAAPFDAFFDGAPLGEAAKYLQVFGAVDPIRAGGVVWDLYRETGSCP